jgi:hypothetical protein
MESITFACGQFSSFRPWSLLLSNLKLRSRSLGAMMDLMRNRAKTSHLWTLFTSLGVSHRGKIPRENLPTSLMDGSEASGARGGMVQGLRFVQAVRRRPLSENILAGGEAATERTNRAQPLDEQSCRAFDRPRHGLSALDPSRPGLSAPLNLTACHRTYSSTQLKVEKATDSEPSQAGISCMSLPSMSACSASVATWPSQEPARVFNLSKDFCASD